MSFGFFSKLKFAKMGVLFVEHYPKLAAIGAIGGILFYAYTFMHNQQEQLAELKTQNQAIVEANQAITKDMQNIKQGLETYNQSLIAINENTKSLQKNFTDQKFRELLVKNLPAAQAQFNQFFNDYLNGINQDTTKNAQ